MLASLCIVGDKGCLSSSASTTTTDDKGPGPGLPPPSNPPHTLNKPSAATRPARPLILPVDVEGETGDAGGELNNDDLRLLLFKIRDRPIPFPLAEREVVETSEDEACPVELTLLPRSRCCCCSWLASDLGPLTRDVGEGGRSSSADVGFFRSGSGDLSSSSPSVQGDGNVVTGFGSVGQEGSEGEDGGREGSKRGVRSTVVAVAVAAAAEAVEAGGVAPSPKTVLRTLVNKLLDLVGALSFGRWVGRKELARLNLAKTVFLL